MVRERNQVHICFIYSLFCPKWTLHITLSYFPLLHAQAKKKLTEFLHLHMRVGIQSSLSKFLFVF